MATSEFADILAQLETRNLHLALGESLTGGLLSAEFVSVPGASKVLLGSVVAYQNSIKTGMLGVSAETLETQGAVSAETAAEMALGAASHFARLAGIAQTEVVGVATTGVAGPDRDGDHPVGEVFVAVAFPGHEVSVKRLELSGDRAQIRNASVSAAAQLLRSLLA